MRRLAGLPALCAALLLAGASALAQTPRPGKPAATASPGATSGDVSPEQSGGKTTTRAAPVEPPAPEAPPVAAEAPPAAPAAPAAAAAPASGKPAPLPTFVMPDVQGIGKSAPAVQGTVLKPGESDWRTSKEAPDEAFGAYQRGHYVAAMRAALKVVETDPESFAAMTLIGELHRDGLGVRQNYIEALRWYRLAEQKGDPQAAFALARAFIEGMGVPQDYGRARAYFERAAEKEHAGALYNLGIMEIEREVPDHKKAAAFFQRSMTRGNVDAVYSLAFLYRNGQGVEKDEARATQLLKQAADEHHLPGMIDYAISLFNGRGAAADETGAAAYLIRAAWRNAPVAQNRLARMYAAGRGVKLDLVEAMKWHVLARANGLKDNWLEDKLVHLTASQREIVEEAVRKFAVK